MAHDRLAPLTIKEMSALASRFEARASSVLLRDQPQLQSDMRLAARLINEWTGRTRTTESTPPPCADQPAEASPAAAAETARI